MTNKPEAKTIDGGRNRTIEGRAPATEGSGRSRSPPNQLEVEAKDGGF